MRLFIPTFHVQHPLATASNYTGRVIRTIDTRFIMTGSVTGGLVLWKPPPEDENGDRNAAKGKQDSNEDHSAGHPAFAGQNELPRYIPRALLLRETQSTITAMAPFYLEGRKEAVVVGGCLRFSSISNHILVEIKSTSITSYH